jgi:hypothetical protein
MFGFYRPFQPGFNVEPPAEPEAPGFRLNADGAVPGQPPAYIPVGWTPNADAYGNAEIAMSDSYGPSFWSDFSDTARKFGEGVKAMGEGVYSIAPGTVNFARGMGRGLGLYGPEEAQRFYREMDATGQGLRFIANNPELSARMARDGMALAFKAQPALPLHIAGRVGASALLSHLGVPPLALFGDAFRALEDGHDFIDAIGRGISGTPPR